MQENLFYVAESTTDLPQTSAANTHRPGRNGMKGTSTAYSSWNAGRVCLCVSSSICHVATTYKSATQLPHLQVTHPWDPPDLALA